MDFKTLPQNIEEYDAVITDVTSFLSQPYIIILIIIVIIGCVHTLI